jgi:MFS family permease
MISMLTCSQARLLLHYGATPGTRRHGFPELGFHIAQCPQCRSVWEQIHQPIDSAATPQSELSVIALPNIPVDDTLPHLVSNVVEHDTVNKGTTFDEYVETSQHVSYDSNKNNHVLYNPVASVPSKESTSYLALLQDRNFRMLWISQGISTFGSFFTRIAVPIYVFNLTNSYMHLGLSFFSSLIAPLLFSLFAGVLVDRFDRRRIMINTDIASSAALLVLVLCTLLPLAIPIKLFLMYVITFVIALLRALYKPARIGIFADVVPESKLLTANSLDGATTTLAEFLSYPVAAAALTLIGPSVAFGVDAASFLVSALLVAQVKIATLIQERKQERNVWAEMKEGLTITISLSPVRKVVILSFIVPLLFALYNALLIPYTEEALGSTKEVGYPVIEAAAALGLLLGMLMLGRWGQKIPRMMLLAFGIFGYGVATLFQGILPQFAPYISSPSQVGGTWTPLLFLVLPLAMICGGANSLILTSLRTVLQENTPRAALGRVYSVMSAAAGSGFAVGALLTGLGQGRSAAVLSALGTILIVLGLVCFWWLPEKNTAQLVLEPNL